jgi:hypothetical protein
MIATHFAKNFKEISKGHAIAIVSIRRNLPEVAVKMIKDYIENPINTYNKIKTACIKIHKEYPNVATFPLSKKLQMTLGKKLTFKNGSCVDDCCKWRMKDYITQNLKFIQEVLELNNNHGWISTPYKKIKFNKNKAGIIHIEIQLLY